MRPSFWIAGVPLLFCGAFFAIANREPISIDLWPLSERIETPLFVALVTALYAGVALGALVAWWAGRHGRRAARDAPRRPPPHVNLRRRSSACVNGSKTMKPGPAR
jgi:uncharacterized integral membrane protein